MNLDEIKKRAECMNGFKVDDISPSKLNTDYAWAADTILQLVAEVEKRDQHILDCYNK